MEFQPVKIYSVHIGIKSLKSNVMKVNKIIKEN